MTSREETAALNHLQQLLASDLSKTPVEELLAGVREVEVTYANAIAWSGRLIAALRTHHDLSWSELVKLTGLPQTTLHRRAQPYL